MTQFQRRGHWRTNYWGTRYWVSGHDVNRYDWDRSDSQTMAYYADRLQAVNAHRSLTATFVNPNANCPVCGASVFYYQNSFGSRVFFDELGPPWPKHPCTDTGKHGGKTRMAKQRQSIEPATRDDEGVRAISAWLTHAELDPAHAFSERYGTGQWEAFRLAKRIRAFGAVLFILEPLSNPNGKRIFLRGHRIPKALAEGSLVFSYRGWVSYFDLDKMQPVDLELSRLRGQGGFISALLGSE